MTKAEQLTAVAAQLSEEQVDALLSFARSMADEPFYEKAPPEAMASLERGLEQIARAETVSLDELSKRLAVAAKPSGAGGSTSRPRPSNVSKRRLPFSGMLELSPLLNVSAPVSWAFSKIILRTFPARAAIWGTEICGRYGFQGRV